ncbi:MAG: acyl-ACP--UDP-N-acetylglucosamine O-acyltransferase [Saprospiraceae bacterium]|jgi:UDP-N-acetylglucosamine acyltransferase|nr:acyl-ACP--UDP-N-acetylglucosamine O-acyltransferase [Saprospiraceae bacterium]MBP9209938.1 acyl-ACP--UDP-N-acetylglucosamine O-acyltransferase [Saprospiraceae bacterium]MBV6473073.1 Acyl-[acyl-carrier-protein]--UDP-N-acetylglucosamine O-acyltransferase [Saprospiraceae bacterium]
MTGLLSNVHPEAQIGAGTVVEPFATIQGDVQIGEHCWIGPYVTIMDGARIGNHCKIFPGAVVSAVPQDLKYNGESSTLEVGDHTVIRECCTLNRGTKAAMTTKVGSHCLLMAYVHVAHDCLVGNNVILANSVNLAGHIEIEDYAIVGGMSAVHQFVKIGAHSMIGGGSLVMKDVPPFTKAARDPLSYEGVNSIGLKRRGFSVEQVNRIHEIYRYLFVKFKNVGRAIKAIEVELPDSPEREAILEFIRNSNRGLMKGYRS